MSAPLEYRATRKRARIHDPRREFALSEIESEVRRTLLAQLTARRVVDVEGPLGWQASAVDLGRLDSPSRSSDNSSGS